MRQFQSKMQKYRWGGGRASAAEALPLTQLEELKDCIPRPLIGERWEKRDGRGEKERYCGAWARGGES